MHGFYEIIDAPDIDAPNRTIRRVRRVDPLRALGLAEREWAAAERLRADNDLAQGYRDRSGDAGRVDCQASADHYTAAQMDALRHMAVVSSGMLMSRREWDVVQYVVLHWWSLDHTARAVRMRRADVSSALRAGLAGLIEYYG